MKLRNKAIAIVLLFVGLVLVNYLASSLPFRADVTAEKIYSLTPGTKAMLGKIEEPITLDLYYSSDAEGLPIGYKNYAARVEEMLRQYVRAARGKLRLNVINPRPDTPDEEKATAAGLSPQVAQTGGDQFFFGLVITQADQQKTVPAFMAEREQFLEYDLSKLVYGVQQFNKPKLGLLTSLPLQGASPQQMQMMMMMRQQPTPGQYVINELEQSFQIVTVDANATEIPAGLDVLMIAHPENVSPKLQFAIDQFLLGGKPVFLAIDPSSQHFKRQGGQQAMMGGGAPNVSSDLPALLNAYGITYNAQKVIGDLENATQVRVGQGAVASFPVWLSLRKANFNATAMPTAQLNTAMFIEPGSIAAKPGTGLTFTPLVETSAQAGELDSALLQMAQPDDVAKQLKPDGKKTVAALVTGKFKTAFPEGAPKDEKPADANSPAPSPSAAKEGGALKESKSTSTLFVIADTDWLFDDYSVRKFNFFGQTVGDPINNNLALASNTLEFLGGSQDLVSIRAKGTSIREFDVVRRMQVEAQKQYQDKLTALDSRLQTVQAKLAELQGKKTEGKKLTTTPEVAKAIEDFQKQSAAMRGERREIRRALREDIDSLEHRLLIANVLASPVLVLAFGLWFSRARRK